MILSPSLTAPVAAGLGLALALALAPLWPLPVAFLLQSFHQTFDKSIIPSKQIQEIFVLVEDDLKVSKPFKPPRKRNSLWYLVLQEEQRRINTSKLQSEHVFDFFVARRGAFYLSGKSARSTVGKA